MPHTFLPSSPLSSRVAAAQPLTSARSTRDPKHRASVTGARRRALARYTDGRGRPREVIVRRGLAGTALVIDRDAITHEDCLLVAHLSADEPAENADFVCESYVHDVRTRRLRCRGLTATDAHTAPLAEELEAGAVAQMRHDAPVIDADGGSYRLERVHAGMSIPALRWRRTPAELGLVGEVVSVREAIARLQDYEPVRIITAVAVASHRTDPTLSTAVLRAELARVQESPIVLNRRLRETALARLDSDGMSMSELAMRCGRIKRDGKGNESGETSWLARRLGLLPESGQREPTPWIHSDVLALIARCGLGVSPREVEVP